MKGWWHMQHFPICDLSLSSVDPALRHRYLKDRPTDNVYRYCSWPHCSSPANSIVLVMLGVVLCQWRQCGSSHGITGCPTVCCCRTWLHQLWTTAAASAETGLYSLSLIMLRLGICITIHSITFAKPLCVVHLLKLLNLNQLNNLEQFVRLSTG